jgi:hypothetical protein
MNIEEQKHVTVITALRKPLMLNTLVKFCGFLQESNSVLTTWHLGSAVQLLYRRCQLSMGEIDFQGSADSELISSVAQIGNK